MPGAGEAPAVVAGGQFQPGGGQGGRPRGDPVEGEKTVLCSRRWRPFPPVDQKRELAPQALHPQTAVLCGQRQPGRFELTRRRSACGGAPGREGEVEPPVEGESARPGCQRGDHGPQLVVEEVPQPGEPGLGGQLPAVRLQAGRAGDPPERFQRQRKAVDGDGAASRTPAAGGREVGGKRREVAVEGLVQDLAGLQAAGEAPIDQPFGRLPVDRAGEPQRAAAEPGQAVRGLVFHPGQGELCHRGMQASRLPASLPPQLQLADAEPGTGGRALQVEGGDGQPLRFLRQLGGEGEPLGLHAPHRQRSAGQMQRTLPAPPAIFLQPGVAPQPQLRQGNLVRPWVFALAAGDPGLQLQARGRALQRETPVQGPGQRPARAGTRQRGERRRVPGVPVEGAGQARTGLGQAPADGAGGGGGERPGGLPAVGLFRPGAVQVGDGEGESGQLQAPGRDFPLPLHPAAPQGKTDPDPLEREVESGRQQVAPVEGRKQARDGGAVEGGQLQPSGPPHPAVSAEGEGDRLRQQLPVGPAQLLQDDFDSGRCAQRPRDRQRHRVRRAEFCCQGEAPRLPVPPAQVDGRGLVAMAAGVHLEGAAGKFQGGDRPARQLRGRAAAGGRGGTPGQRRFGYPQASQVAAEQFPPIEPRLDRRHPHRIFPAGAQLQRRHHQPVPLQQEAADPGLAAQLPRQEGFDAGFEPVVEQRLAVLPGAGQQQQQGQQQRQQPGRQPAPQRPAGGVRDGRLVHALDGFLRTLARGSNRPRVP